MIWWAGKFTFFRLHRTHCFSEISEFECGDVQREYHTASFIAEFFRSTRRRRNGIFLSRMSCHMYLDDEARMLTWAKRGHLEISERLWSEMYSNQSKGFRYPLGMLAAHFETPNVHSQSKASVISIMCGAIMFTVFNSDSAFLMMCVGRCL